MEVNSALKLWWSVDISMADHLVGLETPVITFGYAGKCSVSFPALEPCYIQKPKGLEVSIIVRRSQPPLRLLLFFGSRESALAQLFFVRSHDYTAHFNTHHCLSRFADFGC